jgi:Flp pilus assembly protein TadG
MIRRRTQTGSLAALGFVAMVPLLVAIGAFAVDLMHVNSTKGELQRSCDAAALAGAARLFSYHEDSPKGNKAKTAAEAVLNANLCDGRFISAVNPDVTTNVAFVPAPQPDGTGGACKVDAQIKIRGLFSKIFGSYTQTVTASATAGAVGSINHAFAGQTFPIALGLNVNDPVSGTPLSARKLGDTINIQFSPDGVDNAGWTTLNKGGGANAVRDLITNYRDAAKSGNTAVKVKDTIDLNNGTIASALKEIEDLRIGDTVIMPVVNVTKFNSNAPVVGFVGITITSVVPTGGDKRITGTIVKGELNGVFDQSLPAFDNTAPNAGTFFSDKTVSTPKLIL